MLNTLTMNALENIFRTLKSAQKILALQDRSTKDRALGNAAAAILDAQTDILAANALDVQKARVEGMKEALVDRLALDAKKIAGIVDGITQVTQQEDPVHKISGGWKTSNGLLIERLAVPIGTVAIIYESRPNVTADAFSLAYKAGCSILLRGSSAALESNRAIVKAIKKGLENGGIPEAVELADSGSRNEVDEILTARGWIDVVLPSGGNELIRRVVDNARVPVIETGEGNCHIYVEPSADLDRALDIIANAKLQRPGVCNSVETLLVHKDIAADFLPRLAKNLAGKAELRCDSESRAAIGALPDGLVVKDAVLEDWETEFLDYILAVKIVASVDAAIDHINTYGTKHSEAILTNDLRASEEFCRRVDAACVYTNASTRFTDGGEFGFGAELGISTQKFHARGPMGLEALMTVKYRIAGSGQIRE